MKERYQEEVTQLEATSHAAHSLLQVWTHKVLLI